MVIVMMSTKIMTAIKKNINMTNNNDNDDDDD